MAESANRELTPDEVAEVTGYQELGLALPEKYAGMITEKMFQYIAIGVAVVVVVINGVMRRKTKI